MTTKMEMPWSLKTKEIGHGLDFRVSNLIYGQSLTT